MAHGSCWGQDTSILWVAALLCQGLLVHLQIGMLKFDLQVLLLADNHALRHYNPNPPPSRASPRGTHVRNWLACRSRPVSQASK